MKKIINKPEDVVLEMCKGMVLAHTELNLIEKYKVIKKEQINKNKVSIISGGGSGHEPAHAGYVGKGMLDAAVCGDVFASPSQIQIYQAIKETASDKGTLLVIKNYSGDMMNFKNAAYLAEEVGIQGEPGIRREKIISADELAERMVTALLKEIGIEDGKGEVAVLINGFGSTPLQELYLLNHSVIRELSRRKVTIARTFVGNYMTAIDMAGASISIMKLDENLKSLLSEECDTPALRIKGEVPAVTYDEIIGTVEAPKVSYEVQTNKEYSVVTENRLTLNNIIFMVDQMSECIIRNEIPFCELDSHAGDGDFGMSVSKGFKQLKSEWHEILENKSNDIGNFLEACSIVIMEHCGGASGPIWGSAFRAAGKNTESKTELTLAEFAEMVQASVKGIQATGERS